jgi:ergothioneine biosynthesis protein EgtB
MKTQSLKPQSPPSRESLARRFREVRATTERLCASLETEDYVAQSMPDASPAKWHLAHTSWFFETFILRPASEADGLAPEGYAFLFNSYYNALGERIARASRGLLTRPTVAEVMAYRASVNDRIESLLERVEASRFESLLEIGLHHEQQHQELILTDLKHLFAANPLRPAYRDRPQSSEEPVGPMGWRPYSGGLKAIGFEGSGFAFDNESPRHKVHLEDFLLADRLVTNGEYLGFIEDGGYDRPEFWLSDGWNTRRVQGWTAPLYWELDGGLWRSMTLSGMLDLVESEPVCHISFYEADAFARWSDARLPTEAEWEVAAEGLPIAGNFLESETFHPESSTIGETDRLRQMFGDVWEWTASPYTPYPGYRPASGALGEYNGKFMCNQMVLRGGSCASPRSHLRATYRNFFPPDARWQFSGIRLAKDA